MVSPNTGIDADTCMGFLYGAYGVKHGSVKPNQTGHTRGYYGHSGDFTSILSYRHGAPCKPQQEKAGISIIYVAPLLSDINLMTSAIYHIR